MTTWPAPRRSAPLAAEVSLPGSKSLTNRELIVSALADGVSVIRRPLISRDTDLMIGALRALGAVIDVEPYRLTVRPLVAGARIDAHVDCGLAGTVMRFVPPLAGLLDGRIVFDGDPRARQRPMSGTIDALRGLGIALHDDGRGALPFAVTGTGAVPGGVVEIDASGSSQFVSALLLAGARYVHGVEVRHKGASVPSLPHIDMTVQTLTERGVRAERIADTVWRVTAGPIEARDVLIEPDLSNAGAFVAAALVTRGKVRIADWPARTTQAGDAWRGLAERFGARVELDSGGLLVVGDKMPRGIDVDLHEVGELAPVVSAVCALADSPSRLRGIAHLRGHETDRLAALVTEINRLGGEAEETDDGLIIRPRPLHGGRFETYEDHRIAHAGAVLGLVVDDVEVVDIATTAKTYPDFPAAWERLVR